MFSNGGFSFYIMIAVWASSGLICMIAYGIGEVIEQLVKVNEHLSETANNENE